MPEEINSAGEKPHWMSPRELKLKLVHLESKIVALSKLASLTSSVLECNAFFYYC